MKSKTAIFILIAVIIVALYFILKTPVSVVPSFAPQAQVPEAVQPKVLVGVPDNLKYPKATGKVSDMFALLFNEADVDQSIFNGELKDANLVSGDNREIINVSQSYDENSI